MNKLLNKKVRIYSVDGLMREGILESVDEDKVVIKGKNHEGEEDKIIVFNHDNVFMIEEQ